MQATRKRLTFQSPSLPLHVVPELCTQRAGSATLAESLVASAYAGTYKTLASKSIRLHSWPARHAPSSPLEAGGLVTEWLPRIRWEVQTLGAELKGWPGLKIVLPHRGGKCWDDAVTAGHRRHHGVIWILAFSIPTWKESLWMKPNLT